MTGRTDWEFADGLGVFSSEALPLSGRGNFQWLLPQGSSWGLKAVPRNIQETSHSAFKSMLPLMAEYTTQFYYLFTSFVRKLLFIRPHLEGAWPVSHSLKWTGRKPIGCPVCSPLLCLVILLYLGSDFSSSEIRMLGTVPTTTEVLIFWL